MTRKMKQVHMKRVMVALAITGVVGGIPAMSQAAPAGSLGAPVSLDFSAEMDVNVEARGFGKLCSNKGSEIVIDGTMTFGNQLGLKVIFRNNVKGTKTLEDVGQLTIGLTGTNTEISIPKSTTKVGGNPYLDFKVDDQEEYVSLGRCQQGATLRGNQRGKSKVNVLGVLQAAECSNKGSQISFLADQQGEGVNGSLRITSSSGKNTLPNEYEALLSFAGLNAQDKGWANGAGGNPLIYVQLVQNNGNGWGSVNNPNNGNQPHEEIFLGRCNKLGL